MGDGEGFLTLFLTTNLVSLVAVWRIGFSIQMVYF